MTRPGRTDPARSGLARSGLARSGLARPGPPGLTRSDLTRPRPGALVHASFLALIQGDAAAYESAVDDAVTLADAGAMAYALHIRGYEALMGDESAKAAALFSNAATRLAALGDESGELWATFDSGLAIARLGDLDRGREVLAGAIARCTARGEVFWRSWALWSLAAAEYLLGAASTLWQALGGTINKYVAFIEPMRRDVGIVDQPPAPPPDPDPHPLTARETQIAELVAQGMTNKEIATQLVIAPRTADTPRRAHPHQTRLLQPHPDRRRVAESKRAKTS